MPEQLDRTMRRPTVVSAINLQNTVKTRLVWSGLKRDELALHVVARDLMLDELNPTDAIGAVSQLNNKCVSCCHFVGLLGLSCIGKAEREDRAKERSK